MKRRSLPIQLMIYIFLLLAGTVVVVASVSYRMIADTVRHTTEQNTRESVHQSKQFINSYIQKLKQTSAGIAQNQSLLTYIAEPSEEHRKQLLFLMESILDADIDLIAGTLVTKSGQIVSTDPHIQMKTSSDMMKESWYNAAIHQQNMPILTPARKADINDQSSGWVISVTQEILDQNGENAGVLRLDINYQTLEYYLDEFKLGEYGFTFIVNDQHEFVYHPLEIVYTSKTEMDKMLPYLQVLDGYTSDHKNFVYQVELSDEHWTLISVASLEQIEKLQQRLLFSIAVAVVFSLVISAVLAWLIVRHWIRPLKDLQKVILEVSSGKREVRAKEAGSIEVVDLAKQFNAMLDQIDRLVISVQQQEQSVRQYELQALASQINPHFLYNTLDTIVWSAELNDRKRVVDVTKALAKYFRLALNQGNEQIMLKNELDHVRQYLAIQKIRYGEKLQYEIHELAKYDDYQLPKLVIQPIVENAIYHGIKEVSYPGRIIIRILEEYDHLVISVYDNGKGFSPEKETEKNIYTKKGSVGLKNVDRRLHLQFKEAYHMEIVSDHQSYTDIRLHLPLLDERKNVDAEI